MTPSTSPDCTPSAEAAVPILDEPTDVPTPSAGATGEPRLRQVYVSHGSSGTRLDLAFLDGARTTRRFPDRKSAEAEALRLRQEHGIPPPRPQADRKDQTPVSMQGPYLEGTRFRVVLNFADGGESQRRFVTREAAEVEMARLTALGVPVRTHARRARLVAGAPPEGSGDVHLARRALIAERARLLLGARPRKTTQVQERKLRRVAKDALRETAGQAPYEEVLLGGDLDLASLATHGLE
jgi:hypothetical protein